jgi:choline dehydrogenase-like flavoprotein
MDGSAKKFGLDEAVAVVIGSGAGGGTLANELAHKGIDVVVLEAGRRFDLEDCLAEDTGPDSAWEQFNWRDRRMMTGSISVAADYAATPTFVLKAVGGTTVHWAAQAYRFAAHEWKARSTIGPVAGANLLDWPMELASMASYYERAERRMGVTGRHGVPYLRRTRLYELFAAGRQTDSFYEPPVFQIHYCAALYLGQAELRTARRLGGAAQ